MPAEPRRSVVHVVNAGHRTTPSSRNVPSDFDRRPELEAERARVERERAAARATMPAHYGPTRRKFLPDGMFGYAFPAHLDGTLCGDAGFDPLGLASGSPGDLDRYRELELLHGRWAMLGVVGAAVPEALARFGGFELGEPVWWKVGAAKLNSPDLALDYLGLGGFHIAGSSGLAVIAACQLVLMGGPEYARKVGIDSLVPVGVYLPGDRDYPGGAPFDPFGVSADAAVAHQEADVAVERRHQAGHAVAAGAHVERDVDGRVDVAPRGRAEHAARRQLRGLHPHPLLAVGADLPAVDLAADQHRRQRRGDLLLARLVDAAGPRARRLAAAGRRRREPPRPLRDRARAGQAG